MGLDDSGIAGGREFPTTSWSLIVQARDPSAPDLAHHLGRLVERYWKPVYTVIRYRWAKTDDDAKDLTQEFFATVIFDRNLLGAYAPERGSFRALLRTAVQRFLHDVGRRATTQKRGGGTALASLGQISEGALEAIPGAEQLTPEQIFDVAWNRTVISSAIAVMEAKLTAEGDTAAFEVFRRYDVEQGSVEQTYADLGRELSLSADQVKHHLKHARATFRDVVADIVREYVDGTDELAAELRSLFGA